MSFLRLFSPYVLEALGEKHQKEKLWNNVLYIRSSPGAGKTSLLRVFEPASLNALLNNKSVPEFKETYSALKRIGAISDDKIDVLGVSLSCNRNYQILDDLNIPNINKKRIFFSLLNARITLSFLRAVSKLYNLNFPTGLEAIQLKYQDTENHFSEPMQSGHDLYKWASAIERHVYSAIDSFLPDNVPLGGHNELFIVSVLKPQNILLNGQPICNIVLFMIDDAHKLSPDQRKMMEDYLIVQRGNFSLWISERTEALEARHVIGSFPGRDFEEIPLEKIWQDYPGRFEKILKNIAEKRASISTEDVNNFLEYLEANLNEQRHRDAIKTAFNKVKTSAATLASSSPVYSNWLNYLNSMDGTDFEKLIRTTQVDIILNRVINKNQLTFGFPLTSQELEDKLGNEIESAASLFASVRNNIPYYFSFNSLAKLASNNIEQFLTFAAELYEEMISNKISGLPIEVTDSNQQQIIRDVTNKKWHELIKVIPFAQQVMSFLEAFGKMAKEETFRSSAPYGTGVNGIAIKSSLREKQGVNWMEDQDFEPLVNVLSTCVAYNLLEVKEVTQGKKNQQWSVYYLNRWLCVKNDLPLSYGGWRPKSATELLNWIKP